MLRQLARLTRRVPAAGPKALAIAIYSDAAGELFGARETGVEGVACVDDAARGLVLLSQLWVRTGNVALRRWAEGLLEFVLWMHDGDGRWVNFIYDWEGTKNLAGLTSAPGPNFWQARATEAVTAAAVRLEIPQAHGVLSASFAAAAEHSPPADVRAVHVLSALELLRSQPDPWLASRLTAWCDELTRCSSNGMLMNSPDEVGRPHLWGHVQEAALIEAARFLARGDLVSIARRSADEVFLEVIESGFDLAHVHPYDVQSAVMAMDRLATATGERRYQLSARKARAWFGLRNPAHAAVYLRDEGRVADGIDEGRLNDHSGAEANISAGLALVDDEFVLFQAAGWGQRQA